jgi:hypothetical protein
MISYKDKFLTLRKEKNGSVSFKNDNSSKIIGEGIVRIGKKNEKEQNVRLVEDMKHDIISVNQMCNQGHKLTFNL